MVTLTIKKTLTWGTRKRTRGAGSGGSRGGCTPAFLQQQPQQQQQRRPRLPGRSRLPRGSAPHSCPGLYLTSGPRPAVHRIRQCQASRARPPAPLHSTPRRRPRPSPTATPQPPGSALGPVRPPSRARPAAQPLPQARHIGGRQRGEGLRERGALRGARTPRSWRCCRR